MLRIFVIKVIGTNDGVDAKEATINSCEVKDKDGKTVTTTPSGSAIVVKAVTTVNSGSAIVATKVLPVGTYSVKATVTGTDGKDVILTTSFTVEDKQAETRVSVEKNSVSASTVEEALQKAITVTYGDKTYGKVGNAKNDDIIITKVTGTSNVQGHLIQLEKIRKSQLALVRVNISRKQKQQ